MKKAVIIFVALILLLLAVNWHNSNPKVIILRLLPKIESGAGQLTYRFYLFGVIPSGEAVFETAKEERLNSQKVYHLTATAKPLKIYSKFFKGYAILDSYVDTISLNPVLFRQKLVSPGREQADKEVTYDQKNGIMCLKGVRRQILANTQDPLSLIFNLRRMDFSRSVAVDMNINTNQKNYAFIGSVKPKEISLKNKTYHIAVLKAEIKRRDKNPHHKSEVTIVMLNQKGNIPLLIRIFASGAIIQARLVDIK